MWSPAVDIMSETERSERMRRVRAKGNRSTEIKVRLALVRRGINGWKMHDRSVAGRPDFWFPAQKLALFIDGCFWHGCPACKRPLPVTNHGYWAAKIRGNAARASSVNRELRQAGCTVVRIWEHALRTPRPLARVLDRLFSSPPA
jgi:DNA mismatch endonuclease (patch repair protein)